jgi:hypothetical protein
MPCAWNFLHRSSNAEARESKVAKEISQPAYTITEIKKHFCVNPEGLPH